MTVENRAGNHLLKVCEGILAGIYGLQLSEETHRQLLEDLRSAVKDANERGSMPLTHSERRGVAEDGVKRRMSTEEMREAISALTPEEARDLLQHIPK